MLQPVPDDAADQHGLVPGSPETIQDYLDERMGRKNGGNVDSIPFDHDTGDYTDSLDPAATGICP